MTTAEVELRLPGPDDDGYVATPFGPVGGPPKVRYVDGCPRVEGMDPVFLITPDVLALCFSPVGSEWDGVTIVADRSGLLTVMTRAGMWIYEVFPAVWSDGRGPAIYLAVWPD